MSGLTNKKTKSIKEIEQVTYEKVKTLTRSVVKQIYNIKDVLSQFK